MDLLTTHTLDSKLEAITAPPPTSIVHKSPQHLLSIFQRDVFTSRSPLTASNSGDSSASRLIFTASHAELNWTLNLEERVSYITTDGQSASLSWNKAPSGAFDQIFITVRQLRVCWCRAPTLTRGRVCLLLCTIYSIFTFYVLSCVIHSLT
jgi:hypothetical protein